MNQKPIIRAYEAADQNSCMEAFKTNVPKYFTTEEVDDFKRFLVKLNHPEEVGKVYYYVMELDNQLIGCGGFAEKAGIDGKDAITFAWGLVHLDFHKQGYGDQLLRFRIREIGKLFPGKQVILDTTQFSYTFFEKYDFEIVKYTANGYAEGMHRYDMVLRNS